MVSAAFALSGLLLVSLGPHGLLTSVLAESTKKIINTPLVSTSRAA